MGMEEGGEKSTLKKKASILIVEDDVSIRETMSKILQQNGYRTDTAGNGYEAIQKTEANFYNLALLDIKLPDMEGTRLLAAIHESMRFRGFGRIYR